MPVWEKYRPFVTQYAKVELTRNRNIIQRGQLNGLCFKHKRKAPKEIEAVSPRANRFNNQQLLCIFADRIIITEMSGWNETITGSKHAQAIQ